jgi:hypothetical protein
MIMQTTQIASWLQRTAETLSARITLDAVIVFFSLGNSFVCDIKLRLIRRFVTSIFSTLPSCVANATPSYYQKLIFAPG